MPIVLEGIFVLRWPPCIDSVMPRGRKMKLSSFASLKSPLLPLYLCTEKPSCPLLPTFCSFKNLNNRNSSPPHLPHPIGPV